MKRVTILFWLTIAFGFVVSPIIAVGTEIAKGAPFASAASQWIGHLFEPGYNEFALALIAALPFLAAAVFTLFHLSGEQTPRGRWAGVAGALCAGAALTLWGLISIRLSRSSTASIGYLFLPFEVLLIMAIGYAAGRFIAKARTSAHFFGPSGR
jgi:hypothetical protein